MFQKLAPVADFYNKLKLKVNFLLKYATQTRPLNFLLKYLTETGNVYRNTLQKPAGFCNELKYKADTFYLSTIQKLAPGVNHFAQSDQTRADRRSDLDNRCTLEP